MGDTLDQITIEIPPTFRQFVDGAILRLQAQYPELRFDAAGSEIKVGPAMASRVGELRRQVSYAVYREKIYIETLPLRQRLIDAVTAR